MKKPLSVKQAAPMPCFCVLSTSRKDETYTKAGAASFPFLPEVPGVPPWPDVPGVPQAASAKTIVTARMDAIKDLKFFFIVFLQRKRLSLQGGRACSPFPPRAL